MRPFAPTVCIKLLTCEIRTSYGGNIKGAVASTSTNLAAARPATRIEPDAGGYVAAMTNAFRVVWSTAAIGRKRQDDFACALSATHLFPLLTPAAEMVVGRFSNRPFWVKRFQTIHCCSVDVSRGLVLLFGLGTKALPSWESRTRWNNLSGGLAVRRMAGPSDRTNSPHPSSREGHHSTAGWSSSFLLSHVILRGFHAATACSLVHRNSVPSTQMRCRITASRRARATIAFFFPRRLAICIAQALSQDHLVERTSML